MNILVIGALPISLINFRGPLIQTLRLKGHRVFAAANGTDQDTESHLRQLGVEYFPLRIVRAGMNPLRDLLSIIDLFRLMRRIRPDVVLGYTIKPVIYGSLTARWSGVNSVFSMITGAGYALMESATFRQQVAGWLAGRLYKTSLCYNKKVIFQNPDDLDLFVHRGLIQFQQTLLVNGSGVDLNHYCARSLPTTPIFLMAARLLADKGVREYVMAARRIGIGIADGRIVGDPGSQSPRFLLAGAIDANPTSVREAELRAWQEEGIIGYKGWLDDIRPALAECSVYVLPSYYREGMPRTVLEAMATGRPIITTDSPGCRETVILTANGHKQRNQGAAIMEGENGFLVRPRDASAVAAAMAKFIENPALVVNMGRRSRELAEEKFDVHKVNAVIMNAMGL